MVFWSEVAAAYLDARYYDDAIVYYEALAEITVRPCPPFFALRRRGCR